MTVKVFRRAQRARAPWATLPLLALACAALVLACLAAYFAFAPKPAKTLAPPRIELGSVDRAVAITIEEACAAVRALPKSADAWGKLGMILTAHEMAAEAADLCYRRAGELNSEDVRWPYHRGIALSTGSPEKAIPMLQHAAVIGGDAHPLVRLELAELLLQQGRLQEAEEELRRILERDRTHAPAHLTLARVAFQRGHLQACLAALENALRDARTRKAAHTLRAQTYMRKGDKRAADAETDAASRSPTDVAWQNPFYQQLVELRVGKRRRLAEADELLAQNRTEDAMASLLSTVAEYPDLGWAWLLLGRARLMRNDLSSAEETLRTATRLVPDSAEAQYYLGAVLYLQKDRTAAASCFRRAAELEPTLADAHFNLANCLAEEGDRAGAIEALRAGLRCKPDSAPAHARLGDLLTAAGDQAEAIEHLQTAVELDPTDSTLKEQLEKLRQSLPR